MVSTAAEAASVMPEHSFRKKSALMVVLQLHGNTEFALESRIVI